MALTVDSITNEEIVNTFRDAANEISNMISKLDLIVNHFEAIENITLDDGDPSFSGHEAIEALGKTLANCVIYANEYEKEPFKK